MFAPDKQQKQIIVLPKQFQEENIQIQQKQMAGGF